MRRIFFLELNSRRICHPCARKTEQMDNGFNDVFVEAAQMFLVPINKSKKITLSREV